MVFNVLRFVWFVRLSGFIVSVLKLDFPLSVPDLRIMGNLFRVSFIHYIFSWFWNG